MFPEEAIKWKHYSRMIIIKDISIDDTGNTF